LTTSLALPFLSTQQMQEFKRLLAEVYGVSPRWQQEQAGRNLALLARRVLDDDVAARSIVVLVGPGSSGEIGLAAAQQLLAAEAWLQILLTEDPVEFPEVAVHRLTTLQELGATLAWAEEGWELPPADLVIDAMAAGHAGDETSDGVRNLIQLANSSIAPIICADAPSGVAIATGVVATPHIRAAATVIHSLPPMGLLADTVRLACGSLYLGDIDAPPALYTIFGLDAPQLFDNGSLRPFTIQAGRAWLVNEGSG
jgi:NAD(P)H-hydrate epimerase